MVCRKITRKELEINLIYFANYQFVYIESNFIYMSDYVEHQELTAVLVTSTYLFFSSDHFTNSLLVKLHNFDFYFCQRDNGL